MLVSTIFAMLFQSMLSFPPRSIYRTAIAGCVLLCCAPLIVAEFSSFGVTPEGQKVKLYTLRNGSIEAAVMTWGATLVSLKVPDANGRVDDIVLGFDNLGGYFSSAYQKSNPHFGAIVGRYGNRIAKAKIHS